MERAETTTALGRSRHRTKKNIKTDRKEMKYNFNWTHMAMERVQLHALVNAVKNLQDSYNAADFLDGCDTCSALKD
jgi:hypothetical protein